MPYIKYMTALTYGVSSDPQEWVVRRCIDAFRGEYQYWPGYCERLLTLDALLDALGECSRLWPNYIFSGHKVSDTDQRRRGPAVTSHSNAIKELDRRRRARSLRAPTARREIRPQVLDLDC